MTEGRTHQHPGECDGRAGWSGAGARQPVLGIRVNVTTYELTARAVLAAAKTGRSSYVCFAPVHTIMAGFRSSEHARIVNAADLVAPDGMPVVWALRLLGKSNATRVYGPDLMRLVLQCAQEEAIPVGFYGGASEDNLGQLLTRLRSEFPRLMVVYRCSPPFRPLTEPEEEQVVENIVSSGARILFVGLGGEKQDRWMSAHVGAIPCVMLGVGAAFDFLAGTKAQAPRWIMRCGMEWAFRLASEPRRLWRRYLTENPLFVLFFALQRLGVKKFEETI